MTHTAATPAASGSPVVPRIITHAGNFHADEVMAIALLEEFYLARPVVVADMNPPPIEPEHTSPWSYRPSKSPYDAADHDRVAAWLTGAEVPPPTGLYTPDGVQDLRTPVVVVRTRRPDWVAAGQADPTVFVIDVGAQHDYARRNLDHHHKGFTETWPNGCPLSSTGLVWRWLGQNGHLDVLSAPERAELEERLIQPLDAHDNGVASSPIAAGLAPHNRTGTEESQDVQFRVALDMMRGVLTNTLHGARARLEAERVLTDAWRLAARRGVPYVVLNRPVSYTDCATLLRRISGGQAHLLALPGRGQRWSIISLPGDDGHFSVKCPCPQEWRGRFDLNTTVDGRPLRVVFGHKTGFMSTVLGSRIDVQAACRHIIRTAGLPLTTVPPPHSSHGASSSAPIMSIQTPEAPPRISAFPPGRPMPSAVPSGASAPQSVSSRPSSSARKPQRPSDRVVSAGRPAAAHPYPTKSPATPPAAPSANADAASAKSVHPSTVSPPIAVVPSKGAQGDRPGSKIRAPQFRRQKPSR